MARKLLLLIAVIVVFAVTAAQAGEIKILTWSSYLSPDVVAKFEKETGIRVKIDTVTNYVDLLKPLLTGKSGYDIAFPADFQVRDLVQQGLLEKANVDRLPNFYNIEDIWRGRSLDPRNEYTVPHVWGTTAFVVDTNVYKGEVDTLKLLFAPPKELADKILLMDSGYDMIQLALIHLRLPRCTTRKDHFATVEALLLPMLKRYPLADIDTIVDSLADRRYVVGVAWNGDALKARQKRPGLRYAYPYEGHLVWTDVLAVPKGAPNKADALKFMSFMMRPEAAAMETNYNGYANMIRGSEAFMDKELLNAPEIIAPISASLDFYTYCDNAAERTQEEFWKKLKLMAGKK